MKITDIRVRKVTKQGKMRAVVSVTFDDEFVVHDIKIIEGQIRGLEKMVENDVYCPDILIQVSAVNSALNSFSKELLSKHINGCVREDLANGKDESLDELIKVLHKMMK